MKHRKNTATKRRGNSYPAKAPWYPFVAGQLTELLTSALEGYPYPLKAPDLPEQPVFTVFPVYARRGGGRKVKRPSLTAALFIAIDAFMNET